MFTLAQSLVPGHRHKTVLCSDSLGTRDIIAEFSARAQGLDLVLGHRARILAWVLEKKGVFTLVPTKNRSRAPCLGTKSERSLSLETSKFYSMLKLENFLNHKAKTIFQL